MTKFSARALTSCVPICRSELFEELTGSDCGQPVSSVWMVPGHVFVSVDNGSKLMTFDCKPATHQHSIASSTLDFPTLKPAVLDILISPLTSSVAYIIQQNGHVHCWQFSSNYQWQSLAEFDLCDDVTSEITSICLHPKCRTFYWSERQAGQQAGYRVCSKALPNGELSAPSVTQKSELVVQDCPAADILPMDFGLLIVPWYKEGQSRVFMFWQPSVLQLVSVITIIGSTVTNHHDMRSPLVFSDILLNSLSDLSQKAPARCADLGAQQDAASGAVVMLQVDGTLQSFHLTNRDMKQSIAVQSVSLSMPEAILPTSNPQDVWNIHKGILAIVTHTHTVRLYSATDGLLIHELQLEVGVRIHRLVHVRSPTAVVAMVTSSGIAVVQGGKKARDSRVEQCLPSDKHFQTDALQVALLAQQRGENPSRDVSEELSALYRKWSSLQHHQPRSHLSHTVDGYLAEFWHLEEAASRLGKSQGGVEGCVNVSEEVVREAVTRSRGMSPDGAMGELTWLAQKYPDHLLAVLLGGLDVEKEEVSGEEQALWQRTLGLEGGEGQQPPPQHGSLTFELVCRLLYLHRPTALVSFVRNAQSISEQAVGVSAFVRRKHMLQYYVRAMECLPQPSLATQPQKAALAKAHIILKGAMEQGPELSMRFLLQHGCWSDAIALLRQLGTGLPQHPSLFSLLLQHLMQARALSDYASELFSLLPTWNSFLPALKVMGEHSDSQLSTDCPTLFYSRPSDIPLSAVQNHLLSLLTPSN